MAPIHPLQLHLFDADPDPAAGFYAAVDTLGPLALTSDSKIYRAIQLEIL